MAEQKEHENKAVSWKLLINGGFIYVRIETIIFPKLVHDNKLILFNLYCIFSFKTLNFIIQFKTRQTYY